MAKKTVKKFEKLPVGRLMAGDCIELMQQMPMRSVDVVMASPPYAEKGERYGENWHMPTDDWVDWMVLVTEEALRIAKNCVIWVANGSVKNGAYLPACEGLVWKMYQAGFTCERPVIWYKNATPSRKDWFVNDWEYCLVFRPHNSTRFFNYKLIATPPKYTKGGAFRQRDKNGQRKQGGAYPQNDLTRPRDVIRATVGGGHMGSNLAHECEAPYPESLVKPLLQVTVPQGGLVLDPFCGSGTTLAVAEELKLQWIGFDARQEMIDLSQRRLAEKRKLLKERANE